MLTCSATHISSWIGDLQIQLNADFLKQNGLLGVRWLAEAAEDQQHNTLNHLQEGKHYAE